VCWGRQLLLIGAVVSTLGHVGAMTLAVPRTLFAFARDGFLPAVLARTHPVYRTPVAAIVLQCAIVLVLAITSSFERLAILANISILALYAMCCVAAWRLRLKNVQTGGTPFRVPVPALVVPLALAAIAWFFTGVERGEWIALAVALATATALYLVRRSTTALQ
jgi:amino acid transporter